LGEVHFPCALKVRVLEKSGILVFKKRTGGTGLLELLQIEPADACSTLARNIGLLLFNMDCPDMLKSSQN
jgi:hypothetical protein